MADVINSYATIWTAADLLKRFGAIPITRVRMDPPPGRATEADVVRIHDHENRLYELVDQTLVEKTAGTYESYLAALFVQIIGTFVRNNNLGIVGASPFLNSPGQTR